MIEEDSTWKQMERCLKQEGYREGAATGRESTFQSGFDDGYAEGLSIGRSLGMAEGIAKYNEVAKNEQPMKGVGELIADTKNMSCLICSSSSNKGKAPIPDKFYEKEYSEVVEQQKEHNSALQHSLSLIFPKEPSR